MAAAPVPGLPALNKPHFMRFSVGLPYQHRPGDIPAVVGGCVQLLAAFAYSAAAVPHCSG